MALHCAISGEVPEVPVISPVSGGIFERRLIEKHLIDNSSDPVNGEQLSADQLIEVKTNDVVRPRAPSATSIPALIKLFQDEWDAMMLETYQLREHVQNVRQELSHALYQHDAACRVIARLTRERDQARQALATLQPTAATSQPAPAAAAGAAGESMEVDGEAVEGLPADVVTKLNKTNKTLSKGRKKRAKSATLATAEEVGSLALQGSQTGIHSSSNPGITSLSMPTPSSGIVLTGGADKHAVLFDLGNEKEIARMKGHKKKVLSVELHPGNEVAMTASADKMVCVWDANSGKKHHTISVHGDEVTGVSLHPCGDYFVAASKDKSWSFSTIETGQTLATNLDQTLQSGFSCCQFHPDGGIFGAGTYDHAVHVWNVTQNSKVATFEHQEGAVTALAFSENGYYLASATDNAMVKIWDLRKGDFNKPLQVLDFEGGYVPQSLAFDYSGAYLAVGGSDVRLYGVKGWSQISTLSDHTKAVTGVAFGTDAKQLITTSLDRSLKLYSL